MHLSACSACLGDDVEIFSSIHGIEDWSLIAIMLLFILC